MNDSDACHDIDDVLPEWVWEIVAKHDLGLRVDRPLGGASVLLHDAAYDVQEIAATTFREQEVSPSTKLRLRKAIDMLTDAERLSAVCED